MHGRGILSFSPICVCAVFVSVFLAYSLIHVNCILVCKISKNKKFWVHPVKAYLKEI